MDARVHLLLGLRIRDRLVDRTVTQEAAATIVSLSHGVDRRLQKAFDEFRIAHVQRSDGWIETSWNNMSAPGAFAVAGTEEQEGGEPPPLAGAGRVVYLMDASARPARVWPYSKLFTPLRCSRAVLRTWSGMWQRFDCAGEAPGGQSGATET